jgi:O-antigen/teichoic acid export membrane protein
MPGGSDASDARTSPGGATENPEEPLGSSLTGPILKLAASRGVVIVISLGTAPILGRLFPPEAYGSLGVLTTILGVIAAFASLSYVSAIPLTATRVEQRNLFVLCSVICIIVTGFVGIASFLGADLLADAFHEPDVAQYALFLPLMFLASGVRQLLDTTLSCQRRFGAVAIRSILETTVTRVSQLGLCVFGLLGSPLALILGSLTGNLVAAVTSGLTAIRDVLQTAGGSVHLADLRALAVKHRKFPLVQLWSVTLNALTFGLPAIVLGIQYSVEVVGLYNMAFSMATLPLQLFVGGATQVFYVEAGERVAHGQSVVPATMHLVRVIAILTSLPLVTVLVLGPLLFEVFLGPNWKEAGVFAQVLVPWMALMAVSQPLSVVYAVLNRQGEGFIWNIALVAGRFSALYFGGMFFEVRETLGLFVGVSVVLVFGLMWRALSLFGVSTIWTTKTIASAYGLPLLLLAPCGVLYWSLGLRFAALAALALACLAYAAMIYWYHPEIIKPLLARVPIRWVARLGEPATASEDDK